MPDLPELTSAQIRRVIELYAGGIEDVAATVGKSRVTVEQYTRGMTTRGMEPVPAEVKVVGNVRIFCLPEWVEWQRGES